MAAGVGAQVGILTRMVLLGGLAAAEAVLAATQTAAPVADGATRMEQRLTGTPETVVA